jgi:hypothetical protein
MNADRERLAGLDGLGRRHEVSDQMANAGWRGE